MPVLNREPETPYILGLLVVLGLVLLATVLRHPLFFRHEIFGVR